MKKEKTYFSGAKVEIWIRCRVGAKEGLTEPLSVPVHSHKHAIYLYSCSFITKINQRIYFYVSFPEFPSTSFALFSSSF